jgi:hypothetical protein
MSIPMKNRVNGYALVMQNLDLLMQKGPIYADFEDFQGRIRSPEAEKPYRMDHI